jgi:hypothetical protein
MPTLMVWLMVAANGKRMKSQANAVRPGLLRVSRLVTHENGAPRLPPTGARANNH